ncbi:MAG: VanZ family protein [Ilumatobacteraceae bacterium]
MTASSSTVLASSSRAIGQLVSVGVLPVIAVLVALSWFAAAPLSLRLQHRRQVVFVCLAVTAPILAVTLGRDSWPQGVGGHLGEAAGWWLHGWASVADDLASNSEAFLNVVLFVPAGVAWSALIRRYGRTFLALAAGSFLIETVQALFALGAADTTDLVANSLGAAIGVGVAAVGVAVWRRTKWSSLSASDARWSLRVQLALAAGVVVLAALAVVTVQWRADVARDDLLAELHRTYDDTTLTDMEPTFFGDAGDSFQEFLTRNSVRPDSNVYAADQSSAQVRYPLMYLGFSRCVFVTWTNDGVSFRTGEGGICTGFLG